MTTGSALMVIPQPAPRPAPSDLVKATVLESDLVAAARETFGRAKTYHNAVALQLARKSMNRKAAAARKTFKVVPR